MALTDCVSCWQTPCICGHEYKSMSKRDKDELVRAIQRYTSEELIEWLRQNPDNLYVNNIIELFLLEKNEN